MFIDIFKHLKYLRQIYNLNRKKKTASNKI